MKVEIKKKKIIKLEIENFRPEQLCTCRYEVEQKNVRKIENFNKNKNIKIIQERLERSSFNIQRYETLRGRKETIYVKEISIKGTEQYQKKINDIPH